MTKKNVLGSLPHITTSLWGSIVIRLLHLTFAWFWTTCKGPKSIVILFSIKYEVPNMNGCEASFNIYIKMLYVPLCECIRTVAVPVTCTVWSFASLILPVLHVSTDDLQEIGVELY